MELAAIWQTIGYLVMLGFIAWVVSTYGDLAKDIARIRAAIEKIERDRSNVDVSGMEWRLDELLSALRAGNETQATGFITIAEIQLELQRHLASIDRNISAELQQTP